MNTTGPSYPDPMPRLRPSTRVIVSLLLGSVLAASCSSGSETTEPLSTVASIETVPSTVAQPPTPETTTTTALTNPDDVCRANAGPNVRIRWDELAAQWAALDGIATPEATLDAGNGQDSGQFSFDDGTIVQATVSQNKGEIVELFVISPVDPPNPMAGLPTILDHWVGMLTLTEPRLTPSERVGLLQELGVVGQNLTLLDMNGTVECRQRTYEVAFDVDLAAFVFGVDLAP